eukprot:3462904-Pyramimonas_sp.AAC.1
MRKGDRIQALQGLGVKRSAVHRAGVLSKSPWGCSTAGVPNGRTQQLRMSLLNAAGRFKPGAHVGLALQFSESGWRSDPLVIATADAMQTFVTILAAGMVSSRVVNDLIAEARPWLQGRHAWNKAKNPVSALALSLHRIGGALVDSATVRDDEGRDWGTSYYSAELFSDI